LRQEIITRVIIYCGSGFRIPKDNSEIKRFNQTLEYEWLYNSNLSLDPEEFNPRLTEWLV